MNNPRVFIVNEPMILDDGEWRRALNLEPARDFGALVHVLPAGNLPDDMRVVAEQIRERMDSFDPVNDYMLLIGDPRAMACAAAIAARKGNGSFRMLHWQRRQRRYDCVEVRDLFGAVSESVV